MSAREPVYVIVVRHAFQDAPEAALRPRPRETVEDAIRRHYPSAQFSIGGFDTDDGGSYLYDAMYTTD